METVYSFRMYIGLLNRALVLLTLSLSQYDMATSMPSTEQCGRLNQSDMMSNFVQSPFSRIQGGTEAEPHSWPWTAQLLRDRFHICDAVLIDPSFVLTTSHCVAPSPKPLRYVVLLGGHAYNSGLGYQVVSISIHPLFNKVWSRAYDYALLKIFPPATIDANVSTVCLPTSPPPINRDCVVTVIRIQYHLLFSGWGRTATNGPRPNALQQVSVPIISPVVCNDLFHYAGLLHLPTMMCAGYEGGGADACQGDSGGPLLCQTFGSNQWQLQGLVSWGFGCGQPRFPGVYARIFPVVGWIRSEMILLKLKP